VHIHPITANNEVDAPTPNEYGSTTALKILPPTDPANNNRMYLNLFPMDFSMENPIIKKDNEFQNMWKKL
jgi:hypothetical protein